MHRRSTLLVLLTLVMTAGPVRAQALGQLPSPVGKGRPTGPGSGTISFELESVDVGKPVLNSPYSAEAVTEVIQTLADGNRIEQRTSAVVARDSRGRTRHEQHGIALGSLVASGDSPMVTITDPNAGTHLNLQQDTKIAQRSYSIGAFPPVPSSGVRAEVDAREAAPATGESPPEIRTRKLGTKEVEGLRVEGTETTVIVRAGAVGNKSPLRLVSERWYSSELKVVVMSRRVDPRFGETRFRLTNIVRGEPPAHLFQVPSDFRIEDRPRSPAQPIRREEVREEKLTTQRF